MSTPEWLSLDPSNLPRALTSARAWYPAVIKPKTGKVGQWDKIPSDPETAAAATWSDPATRCTFDQAYMAYQRDPRFKGIGYMMHGDGHVGIDLDKCISPDGTIAAWAQAIVDSFPGAYWERSISGTGLRGFCRGNLGDVGGVRSKIEGCSVEVYADVRFLVVTGQALQTVDELPELQEAVSALQARLTAGRERSSGTAIVTGLTGRTDNPTPDEMAIVSDVMGGRWGDRMLTIWSRDDLHVAGASEADWALESEIAYWAIRRGLTDDALKLTVERIMRAGPYRAKWDSPRGKVTWLAQDVANAIATVQERLKKYQTGPDFDADFDDITPTDETPAQKIARLERDLAQTRTIVATQMAVIRRDGPVLRSTVETIRRISDVIALPSKQLAPAAKLVTIATLLETHSRSSRGQSKLPLAALVERTGLSKNAVANHIQDLAERAGSPISRHVTRDWVIDEFGQQRPISVSIVSPHHDTVNESFAAVLTMGAPGERAQKRAAEARERTAEWGRCSSHDNDLVAIKGCCPECGEVVGERLVRVEEFDLLNPIVCDSEGHDAPVNDPVTKGHIVCDSAEPTSLFDYAEARPKPWRCPECGALEREIRPDGSWRCQGWGHTGRDPAPTPVRTPMQGRTVTLPAALRLTDEQRVMMEEAIRQPPKQGATDFSWHRCCQKQTVARIEGVDSVCIECRTVLYTWTPPSAVAGGEE